MAISEEDFLSVIRDVRERRPALQAQPVLSRLERFGAPGIVREDEDDEESAGFLTGLFQGASRGLLEPLGFLPPVGRFLEAHMAPENPHMGGKVGYALGWLGGFAVPSTAALKISSVALRSRGMIQAADAAVDLGLKGNLLRGSLAGSLLGAGREAEDGQDRIENILTEAALFGIGDAVAHPLLRMISGATFGGVKQADNVLLDVVENGGFTSEEGAVLGGRAMRLLDELIPPEKTSNVRTRTRKAALLAGLERIGFSEMRGGEIRMVPSIQNTARDVKAILKPLGNEIDFAVIPHQVGSRKVSDVLVAPKGQLDDRVVSTYRENIKKHNVGFFPGQTARHKGVDKVILGATGTEDVAGQAKLWLFTPGRGTMKAGAEGTQAVPLEELTILPHGIDLIGPSSVPKPAQAWVDWVKTHGEFPEQSGFDWDTAFREFADSRDLNEAQAKELYGFFAERYVDSLARIDKPLGSVIRKLKKFRPGKHPDGPLAEQATQLGYLVERLVPDPTNGKLKTVVRIQGSGQAIEFATDKQALAFMKANPQPLPDFLADVPTPGPTTSLGFSGTNVMPAHSAAKLSNFEADNRFGLYWGAHFAPREAFIRTMEDQLRAQGHEISVLAPFQRMLWGNRKARQESLPWVEELWKIRGKGKKVRVRDDRLPTLMEGLLSPRKELDRLANVGKWTKQEKEAIIELKDYMGRLLRDIDTKSKLGIGTNTDDFIENYLPFILQKTTDDVPRAIVESFEARGRKVSKRALKFVEEMGRTGLSPGPGENDPFMVALSWTRTAFAKRHTDKAFKEIRGVLETLPVEGDVGILRRSIEDALKLAYGQTPEAYYVAQVAAEGYFKNIGIELSTKDIDRMMRTLISMNYGAFMAFRPALAIRNLTQTIVTTLPMVQSARHMGEGFRRAIRPSGMQKARDAVAIQPRNLAAPFQDQLQIDSTYALLARQAKNPLGARLIGTAEKLQEFSHVGLGGEVTVAGKKIPTGLYGRADEFNRAVAFHAQQSKTEEALRKWLGSQGNTGHNNIARFNEEAGLTMLGESITTEFHKLVRTSTEDALEYIGRVMADETQWIYQMGAGPAAFSQGLGRLFGMYGTWPAWYISQLARGMNRGTAKDRARFWGWTMATWAAFPAATYASGINFSKWTPLNSLTWTGGPAVDWFADWRDIISGANPPGTAPTPRRALALAERGIRDTGDRLPIPFVGHLDPRRGQGLDVENPARMGRDLLYLFTPGASQVRDLLRSGEQPTPFKTALAASGFQPVAGESWPQIRRR